MSNWLKFYCLISFLFLLFPLATYTQNTNAPVGTPHGNFAVSPMGGATYSVTIEAPKGLPGIQPQVGISYNSQAGNGLVGLSCNLSGFSIITRGPRSIWYDGTASGTTYGKDDAFFLDGQRLIEQENIIGCDSAVYCLESNPYTRVVLHGRNASSQYYMWFQVITPDGTNSKYEAKQWYVKNATIKTNAWFISSVTNSIGNQASFTYSYDGNYLYPNVISYGQNSIQFTFEQRPDTIFFSLEGTSGYIGKRLKTIKTKTGSNLYREYTLNYSLFSDATATGFSHLSSCTVKNGAGEEMNPISFEWDYLKQYTTQPQTMDVTLMQPTQLISFNGDPELMTADFNGDGISDIIQYIPVESIEEGDNIRRYYNDYYIFSSQNIAGDMSYSSYPLRVRLYGYGASWTGESIFGTTKPIILDWDGDGLQDMIVPYVDISNSTTVTYFIVRGNDLSMSETLYYVHNPQYSSDVPFYTSADFNNDGMSDIIILDQAGQNSNYHCCVFPGNSDGLTNNEIPITLQLTSAPKKLITGDFNIDGMSDILVVCENGYKIFWNRGGGLSNNTFSSSDCTSGTTLSDNIMVRDGDFNGDGIPDLLTNATGSCDWYFYLGKGDGTFTKKLACTKDIYDQTSSYDDNKFTCLVYDMDGDGKSDVYMSKAMYNNWGSFQQVRSYWMLSDGSSLIQRQASSSQNAENASPRNYLLGNFSGNGQPELAHYGYDCWNGVNANVSSSLRNYSNSNYAPGNGRIKYITNGLGHQTLISYKSLTDHSVYTRNDLGEYPLFVVKPALPVVSSTTVGNGRAGNMISNYTYEDLMMHQPGRGLLGFTTMTVENQTLGTTTETSVEWDELTLTPYKTWEIQTIGNNTATTESTYLNHIYNNTKAIYHSLASSKVTDMDGHVTNTVYSCDSIHHNVPLEITQTGYDNAQVKTTYSGYVYKAGQYLPTSISTRHKHPDDTQYFTTTNKFTYNSKGLKTSETNLYGTSAETNTIYTYDNYGNMTNSSTSGTGVETVTKQYTYDSSNRFVVQSLERGYVKNVYTHDTWGNVLTASDQTRSSYPLTTTNTYDGWGRLKKSISPIGIVTNIQWSWDYNNGYTISKTETGQPSVETSYDNTGRKWHTQTIGPKGVTILDILTFNNKGLIASKTHSEGSYVNKIETFTYDNRGRILTSTLNLGESTTYTYGINWIRTRKAGQNYTKYYDSWGNIKSSTEPASSVSYKYYSNGNLKSATTENKVVSMEYDPAGRRTKMTDPSAGITNYTYDAYGRLLTQTDARGNTTTNTYNSRGQLTNSTTGTIVNNYVYGDNAGNNGLLISATRSSNPAPFTAQYTYDSYGRVTSETHMIGPISKSMSYTYNTQGHIATQTYPNQLQISYEYDNYGYLNRMFSGTKQLYELDEYTGDTYVAILDNDITSYRMYDPYGRLYEAGFLFTDIPDKYYQEYHYDQNTGNISSRILGDMQNDEETFTYDNMDRLTSWTKGNTTIDYEYDTWGSMSYKSDLGYYSYTNSNPYAVSEFETYTGNLNITKPNVYTLFDGLGMAKQISSNNYQTNIYYGPDNQRWRSNASDNVFYFDNYEEVTTNNVTRTYVYLENGILAVSDNTNGTQFYYIATDVLGSVIGIVDGSGNEVFAATYDPWGKQTITTNTIGFRRGFTGHEMLPHYDLINMNGRLYDPYLARFLSPDNYVQMPDFSQSFNRYSYCLNNPLKYTDPSGELFGIDDAIIAFTVFNMASSMMFAAYNGDNIWKAAGISLLSSAASYGIGSIFGPTGTFGHELLRAGAHGFASGAINALNGGSFGSGFASGFISSGIGSFAQGINMNPALMITSTSAMGGMGAWMTGGDFLQGSMQGLKIGLLNHAMHGDIVYKKDANGNWIGEIPEVVVTPHSNDYLLAAGMGIDALGFAMGAYASTRYYKSARGYEAWRTSSGKVYDSNILQRQANGKYVRGVQGIRASKTIAKKTVRIPSAIGKAIGALGTANDAYNYIDNPTIDNFVVLGRSVLSYISLPYAALDLYSTCSYYSIQYAVSHGYGSAGTYSGLVLGGYPY